MLAQTIDEAGAQHKVAHRTGRGAGRTAQARRHHAADRSARAKMRRLKRQALALLGQRCFQLGQWRATPGRDHQFAGLVADNAAVGARIEYITRQALAPKVFTAAAAQTQHTAFYARLAHGIDHGIELGFHD